MGQALRVGFFGLKSRLILGGHIINAAQLWKLKPLPRN
jgi:hypothetical protein